MHKKSIKKFIFKAVTVSSLVVMSNAAFATGPVTLDGLSNTNLTLTSSESIIGGSSPGVNITGTNKFIDNGGSITSDDNVIILNDGSSLSNGIQNYGTILSDFNYGVILTGTSSIIGGITNSGNIYGTIGIQLNGSGTQVDFINNTGEIKSIDNSQNGIANAGGHIDIINNSNLIQGQAGIGLFTGSIGTIRNTGSIVGTTFAGILNFFGSIDTVTNLGVITEGAFGGIANFGSIETLNNFQGNTGSGQRPLFFYGFLSNLPAFYNIIVRADAYGQLVVGDGISGQMTFGIFGGDAANGIAASQLKSRVYEDVVMGVSGVTAGLKNNYSNSFNTSTPITSIYGLNGAAFGNYNGVAWMLTDATYRQGGTDIEWDLTAFNFGKDLAEPQRALLEQRQQAIRNGLDYDCKQFDKDGVCVSFKARYSDFGGEKEGAGVLTVAKRIDTGLRVGAFVDERIEDNKVNGIKMDAGLPMFGIFGAYSAGKDGTGLQARVSAAFEHGKADITRNNMLGTASEVTGKANVDSIGVAERIGWGFGLGNKNVLTPYLGLRYTEAKRAAYDEAYRAGSVIDPFNYAAYSEHRVTGTIGADLDGNLSKDVTYRLGAGVDYDFANNLDTFSIDSVYFGNMTYTSTEKVREHRAFGLAGLGFNIDANKTLMLDGNVSQMDYGNDLAYSLMAGYQMAF